MYVIACYDVPAERTEKYRKLLAKYLLPLQESVFAGDLTEVRFRDVQRQVRKIYAPHDHVLWITTPNRRNISVEEWRKGERAVNTDHLGSAVT